LLGEAKTGAARYDLWKKIIWVQKGKIGLIYTIRSEDN
jgi:hypothetical protein